MKSFNVITCMAARESGGMFWSYFPVRNPPANGDHVMRPEPTKAQQTHALVATVQTKQEEL